jgi:prepilin-type N-terminal cleavage/methylation domain-containing protein
MMLMGLSDINTSGRGFTLIELMVVVTIVGVLASIAIPYVGPIICKGHLSEAQPYLLQIASKMRSFKIEQGSYFSVANGNQEEQDLEDNLGVNLQDAANFCFVAICKQNCQNVTSTNPIAAAETGNGDTSIDFEVWAILRRDATGSISGPNGATCNVAESKLAPSGWVKPQNSGSTCQQGQVIVHRYPPPVDGLDSVSSSTGKRLDWLSGTTMTDAILP